MELCSLLRSVSFQTPPITSTAASQPQFATQLTTRLVQGTHTATATASVAATRTHSPILVYREPVALPVTVTLTAMMVTQTHLTSAALKDADANTSRRHTVVMESCSLLRLVSFQTPPITSTAASQPQLARLTATRLDTGIHTATAEAPAAALRTHSRSTAQRGAAALPAVLTRNAMMATLTLWILVTLTAADASTSQSHTVVMA